MVCVCARARVRACMRECVCVCVNSGTGFPEITHQVYAAETGRVDVGRWPRYCPIRVVCVCHSILCVAFCEAWSTRACVHM